MKIDTHYELLAKLYLRLKGFIVTNLIIHSDEKGNLKSELDILAIRMPLHIQDYRAVLVDDYFECSNTNIEVVIADVKNYSKKEELKFNKGLRNYDSSIEQLINWIGINENKKILDKFKTNLNFHKENNQDGFVKFDENLSFGKFTFKFTFFCPSLPKWDGKGFKYIDGGEMIDFIWECLNEKKNIDTCSRRYNFAMWNELEEYVLFFKGQKEKVSINDFEHFCKNLKTKK